MNTTIQPYPKGTHVKLSNGFSGTIGEKTAGATKDKANREPFYYTFNADNGQSFTIGHSEVTAVVKGA
jgi:hypothetical protein